MKRHYLLLLFFEHAGGEGERDIQGLENRLLAIRLGETLQAVMKCCHCPTLLKMRTTCYKHKHLNPCSVYAFAEEMDDIKDFNLHCIICSLVFVVQPQSAAQPHAATCFDPSWWHGGANQNGRSEKTHELR